MVSTTAIDWRLVAFVPLLLLGSGCSTTETISYDHAYNYENKFSLMPTPKAEVVNSRLERVTSTFVGKPWSTINGEWEFELIATRAWTDKIQEYYEPTDWDQVKTWLRGGLSPWFAPDPEKFVPFHMPGPSSIAAHLFVEKTPSDPDRIRLFVCRH